MNIYKTMNAQNDIEKLIQRGDLSSYLNGRMAQDVLFAYENTFGGVQQLAYICDILDTVCRRLERASPIKRYAFWIYLNARKDSAGKGLTQKKHKWTRKWAILRQRIKA
jgi:hypothetical protein